MTEVTDSVPAGDDEKQPARKQENNPFSEQEKHGEEAQYQEARNEQEYQGNTSVQRRAPGTETDDDADLGSRKSA